MSDDKNMNKKIRESLIQIIDLISNNDTQSNGLDKFHILITEYQKKYDKLTFIIHTISEFISKSPNQIKKENSLILLVKFIEAFPAIEATYPYISRMLTTIQSNISNLPIEKITSLFLSIIKLLFNKKSLNEDQNLKHNFELFQGFCLYNMKQNEADCQICGASCLNVLINNCFYFFEEKYLKYIWEKIITFLDSKDYKAKYILLSCLTGLLRNIKQLFKAYAIVTLYKIIDFLEEDNIEIKREALNVIYLLVLYCKCEVNPLKEQIIEFLDGLMSEDDQDIRQKCVLIFKEYNIGNSFAKQMKNKQIQQRQRQKKQISSGHIHINQNDNNNVIVKSKKLSTLNKKNSASIKKHSIFKTNRNNDFFKRAKNDNEILVVDYSSSATMKNDIRTKENNNDNDDDEENKQNTVMLPQDIYNESKDNVKEEHQNYVINTYPYKEDPNLNNQSQSDFNTYHDNNNNNNFDHLLNQIRTLNHNQITLLDTVSSLQSNLYNNISKLFLRVDELEVIYEKQPDICPDQYSLIEAINNDDIQFLITLLIEISLDNLKELDQSIIDQSLNKLLNSLNDIHNNKAQKPYIEIALIKKIIIGIELDLTIETITRIKKDLRTFFQMNMSKLSSEDKVDIALIQSYLD